MAKSDIPASPASIKYFYTDPLAAAWMDKHFGLTFLNDRSLDDCPDDAGDHESDTAYEADCGWGRATHRKYYIHPASLALLEPIEGDLVRIYNTWSTVTRAHSENIRPLVSVELANDSALPVPIIQRNGIPFHWPEQEADNGQS